MTQMEPKIYVACLAAYNNGILHCDWIDANQDPDDLRDAVNIILATSPIPQADEWAIHDYDDFGGVFITESMGLTEASTLAAFVVTHGELGAAVLAEANGDLDEAERMLDERYHGEFDSEENFAISLAEETMEIPDHLSFYIDYKSMARDLFINDFVSIELNYMTHVFSCY